MGEWEEKKLGEILKIGSGRDYKHLKEGNIPVFGTGGYMTSVNDYLFDGESVCIGRKGTINKPFYYNGKFWTVDTLFYTYSYKNVLPRFIFNGFEQINWLMYNEASGVPSLSKSTIEQIEISIPDIYEQAKIASFLTLIEERILAQSKIIDRLESLIKGVIQTLMRDSKVKSSWRKLFLRDILTESKEFNRNNYPVFSVSVSKGVINQIDYLGRSFAAQNTSNYNVVHLGDIVYTKSPTGKFPYGIVKQSKINEDAAVSPLYGVYKPKSNEIGNILHHYFNNPINTNNYLHSLIQKGAKNTINITNQNFLNKELFLPTDVNEIKIISDLLKLLSLKIARESSIYDKLNEQKKHLLKQMFI